MFNKSMRVGSVGLVLAWGCAGCGGWSPMQYPVRSSAEVAPTCNSNCGSFVVGGDAVSAIIIGSWLLVCVCLGAAQAGHSGSWEFFQGPRPPPPETRESCDEQLREGPRILGVVTDADGKPVAGARVVLRSSDGWIFPFPYSRHATRTQANGTFVMTGVSPGDYRVCAEAGEKKAHVPASVDKDDACEVKIRM